TAYLPTTSTVRAGIPIEYDPVRAEYYMLTEPQATNGVVQSQSFSGAPWGLNIAPVTPNIAIAPDGTMTADGQVPVAGVQTAFIQQAVTITVAPWTWSVYI